ncbi:MAG TPA: hypothetical protein VH370_06950 [Humisphaera sp.]|jgi:hypothetical protein|nr:hypothetical protein [Humisphaera sp.]
MPTTTKTKTIQKTAKAGRRMAPSKGGQARSRSFKEEPNSLEARIVDLAVSGKLAEAGRRAIEAQIKLGLPVTIQKGDKVIKRYQDGREEVLETIPRRKFKIPKGVAVIPSK